MCKRSFIKEQFARRTFGHYDRDRDGVITTSDLKTFFGDLGKTVPDTELQAVRSEVDLNGDGSVNLEEFIQAWTPPIPSTLLKLRFFGYDLDGSGFVDITEYKKALAILGQLKTDRQFTFHDKNQDGKISFEEYEQTSSKCEIMIVLRLQYLIRNTGSVPVVHDTCSEA